MAEGRRSKRPKAKGLGYYFKKPPLEVPLLNEEIDLKLISRLIKREIPEDPDIPWSNNICAICYSKGHSFTRCPCLSKIEKDDVVLSSMYDTVCLGCGTIGLDCCGQGTYAVGKLCSFCMSYGHWFWEEMCEDYYIGHDTRFLWNSVKDGNPLPRRPLLVPDYCDTTHAEEIRRLMKREEIPRPPVLDDCCIVCYEEGHLDYKCPCLRSLPEGKVVGPEFDEACLGCGKIGMRCCGMGAYAVPKWCNFCQVNDHWFWEEKCTDRRPEWVSVKNSLTMKDPSTEDSLPHEDVFSSCGYFDNHLFSRFVKMNSN